MREGLEARELSAFVLRLTHTLYRVTEFLPRDEPLRRGIREKAGEIFAAGVATAHGKMHEGEADEAGIAIEILLGYLGMARMLGCADPVNFLVLEREYRMLAETLAAVSGEHTIKEQGEEGAYGQWPEPEPKSADSKGTQKESTAIGAGAERPPAGEQKMNREVNPVRDNPDFGPDAIASQAQEISNRVNERQRKIMERLAAAGQVKISDFYDTFGAISTKTIQRDLQDLTTRNMIKKAGEKRWTIYTLA